MDYKVNKEAVDKIIERVLDNGSTVINKNDLEEIFPELCESEDERIRQFLIHEVTETSDKVMSYRNMNKKDVLAWLEKQGEIIKEWSEMKMNNIQTELQEMVDLKQKIEQGEQKPAVAFKVGDYIICRNNEDTLYQITDSTPTGYMVKGNDGIIHSVTFEQLINCNAILCVIQKQKPADKVKERWIPQCGDIVRKKGTIKPLYTLCKETEGGFSFVTEIGNATGGGFLSYNILNGYELVKRPQNIKDVVDKVHKPLIELTNEHKTIEWDDRDKNMERFIGNAIMFDVAVEYLKEHNITTIDAHEWLKSLKDRVQPKQEWKQENTDDLTDFENAMMHIGGSFFGENAGLDPNDTNAIKEQANILLGLVPKKEWSEEDEEQLGRALYMMEQLDMTKSWDDVYNWLKSLRPQKQ